MSDAQTEAPATSIPPIGLRLNTLVLIDGRVGTICYHFLSGCGGVWGVHEFKMPERSGFGDELPYPDFMLREKEYEPMLRRDDGWELCECVGLDFDYCDAEGNVL